MLTFAITVFLLIVTPGPGVLSTAGFGAAYGYKKSLRYVFGLFLGTTDFPKKILKRLRLKESREPMM
jgi:threonine/homoserine/homoserine lactone efflux protein